VRIGFGYDVHAFEPGDNIILGGIKIPFDKAFKAHSDGDVLLHSICDAILGAAALGDIGKHFPDTDPIYHNVSSLKLLDACVKLIKGKGYKIGNIDSTVALQKPKLQEYILQMRESIANCCEINIDEVSVKATTTEKLGFVGEEKGAESYAIVMLF
jgi:2-C-methyl-D-erythritol 2,4-cyclodiphosphate synthase